MGLHPDPPKAFVPDSPVHFFIEEVLEPPLLSGLHPKEKEWQDLLKETKRPGKAYLDTG